MFCFLYLNATRLTTFALNALSKIAVCSASKTERGLLPSSSSVAAAALGAVSWLLRCCCFLLQHWGQRLSHSHFQLRWKGPPPPVRLYDLRLNGMGFLFPLLKPLPTHTTTVSLHLPPFLLWRPAGKTLFLVLPLFSPQQNLVNSPRTIRPLVLLRSYKPDFSRDLFGRDFPYTTHKSKKQKFRASKKRQRLEEQEIER